MKKLYLLLLAAAIFTIHCCKTDDTPEMPTKNNVQFRVDFDDEVEMFKNKSASFVNKNEFIVMVISESQDTIIRNKTLASISTGIYLDEGTYTVKTHYGDTTALFDWNKPVYIGESTFDVTPNVITQVQLHVKLSNTKVEVLFTDFIKEVYPEISVDITSQETNQTSNFANDNTKFGYFAKTENFTVTVKPKDGVEHVHEIAGVKPNMYYKLTFTAKEQGGDFEIIIDEEDLIEIEYDVPIKPGDDLPNEIGKTYSGNVTWKTQGGIASFIDSGYEVINGNLTIDGNNLNTTGVTLRKVTGNLLVKGSGNLSGLSSLVVVDGNLTFSGNQSLAPLTKLVKIGGSLTISGTTPSTNCTGLNNLKEIVENFNITFKPGLHSMTGLDNLYKIGKELYVIPAKDRYNNTSIYTNYDRSLSRLKNLKSINWLTIGEKTRVYDSSQDYYSSQITSLNGLESLEHLNGFTVNRPTYSDEFNNYYLYDYCGVPVEIWQNMQPENYQNGSTGYKPTLEVLQQGICAQ